MNRIKNLQECEITFRVFKKTRDPLEEIFKEIVTKPNEWCKNLLKLKLNSLLRLLDRVENGKTSTLKEKAKERIQNAIKQKYGFLNFARLVMKIPFSENQHTGKIRFAIREVLEETTLGSEVKSRISNDFRVVNTRRKSIADLFHNHVKFAKIFDQAVVPECVCKNQSHDILLPSAFNQAVRRSKNIPWPCVINTRDELEKAFREVIRKLSKFLKQSESNAENFKKTGFYDSCDCDLERLFLERNQRFQKIYRLLEEASNLRKMRLWNRTTP